MAGEYKRPEVNMCKSSSNHWPHLNWSHSQGSIHWKSLFLHAIVPSIPCNHTSENYFHYSAGSGHFETISPRLVTEVRSYRWIVYEINVFYFICLEQSSCELTCSVSPALTRPPVNGVTSHNKDVDHSTVKEPSKFNNPVSKPQKDEQNDKLAEQHR